MKIINYDEWVQCQRPISNFSAFIARKNQQINIIIILWNVDKFNEKCAQCNILVPVVVVGTITMAVFECLNDFLYVSKCNEWWIDFWIVGQFTMWKQKSDLILESRVLDAAINRLLQIIWLNDIKYSIIIMLMVSSLFEFRFDR